MRQRRQSDVTPLEIDEREGVCAKCQHRSEMQSPSPLEKRLRLFLGLKLRPAKCGAVEPDYSGWSSGIACECRHAFHGS